MPMLPQTNYFYIGDGRMGTNYFRRLLHANNPLLIHDEFPRSHLLDPSRSPTYPKNDFDFFCTESPDFIASTLQNIQESGNQFAVKILAWRSHILYDMMNQFPHYKIFLYREHLYYAIRSLHVSKMLDRWMYHRYESSENLPTPDITIDPLFLNNHIEYGHLRNLEYWLSFYEKCYQEQNVMAISVEELTDHPEQFFTNVEVESRQTPRHIYANYPSYEELPITPSNRYMIARVHERMQALGLKTRKDI
jgi:hypothetical protein